MPISTCDKLFNPMFINYNWEEQQESKWTYLAISVTIFFCSLATAHIAYFSYKTVKACCSESETDKTVKEIVVNSVVFQQYGGPSSLSRIKDPKQQETLTPEDLRRQQEKEKEKIKDIECFLKEVPTSWSPLIVEVDGLENIDSYNIVSLQQTTIRLIAVNKKELFLECLEQGRPYYLPINPRYKSADRMRPVDKLNEAIHAINKIGLYWMRHDNFFGKINSKQAEKILENCKTGAWLCRMDGDKFMVSCVEKESSWSTQVNIKHIEMVSLPTQQEIENTVLQLTNAHPQYAHPMPALSTFSPKDLRKAQNSFISNYQHPSLFAYCKLSQGFFFQEEGGARLPLGCYKEPI